MSTLTDRLRGIVGGAVPRVPPELRGPADIGAPATFPQGPALGTADVSRLSRGLDEASLARAAAVLGGSVTTGGAGATIVVDRHYAAASRHGRATIGEIADVLLGGQDALSVLTAGGPSRRAASGIFPHPFLA